jgi:hypothetical protein
MRVLCVEDNEDNVYLLKMRLELIEGYEIKCCKARRGSHCHGNRRPARMSY